ncbi:RHS repeat-associated core domain-containing protein [Saccharothrix isguenensis]
MLVEDAAQPKFVVVAQDQVERRPAGVGVVDLVDQVLVAVPLVGDTRLDPHLDGHRAVDGQSVAGDFHAASGGVVVVGQGAGLLAVDRARVDAVAVVAGDVLRGGVAIAQRTADGRDIVSAVTRSQSGTIIDETLGGVDARPGASNYVYDAAGRLTEAWVAGHHYTYDFTSPASSTCPTGSASNAGANTNRVRLLDRTSAGTAETAYCYDTADRLLATTGATAVTGIEYDNHGNTTRFTNAGSTTNLEWDGAGRNTAARTPGAEPADIAYTRDATDRIVSAKNVLTRSIALPGGVLLIVTGTGRSFDRPTVRGDLSLTTDTAGNQAGPLRTYSSYGEPLTTDGTVDPDAVPDNQPGQMDYGWLGQHQRPYEHAVALSLVQMGARPYSPLLGRFLSVDPVDGRSAKDYDYDYDYVTANPINANDLDGRVDWGGFFKKALTVASVAVAVGCVVASAGACLVAGAVLLGAQTAHEWGTTGRVDMKNFALNAAFTAIGGGAGRAMSSSWFAKSVVRTPQKHGRHWKARVRHTLPVNWRATARNWGNNAHVNTFQIAAIQSWDAYRTKAMRAV